MSVSSVEDSDLESDLGDQATGVFAQEIYPDLQTFPETKTVEALSPLPVARFPHLNPESSARVLFGRIQNIVATLIQISGKEAREPCVRCRNRKGLWSLCVISNVPEVRAATRGACASCYYNGKGRGCDFHDYMKNGRQEQASLRKELSMPDINEALHHVRLGLDGIQRWFDWYQVRAAPALREGGDLKASL